MSVLFCLLFVCVCVLFSLLVSSQIKYDCSLICLLFSPWIRKSVNLQVFRSSSVEGVVTRAQYVCWVLVFVGSTDFPLAIFAVVNILQRPLGSLREPGDECKFDLQPFPSPLVMAPIYGTNKEESLFVGRSLPTLCCTCHVMHSLAGNDVII